MRQRLHAGGVPVLRQGPLQRRVVCERGGDGRVIDFVVGALGRPGVWIGLRVSCLVRLRVSLGVGIETTRMMALLLMLFVFFFWWANFF